MKLSGSLLVLSLILQPWFSSQTARAESNPSVFYYPGTTYRTELTSINDKGIAVGWFMQTGPDETCDPAVFGETCPGLNSASAFVYKEGKPSRLKIPTPAAGSLMPLAISNRDQILLVFVPASEPFAGDYLRALHLFFVYDLNTGALEKIGQDQDNGVDPTSGKLQITDTLGVLGGINSKGEIAASGRRMTFKIEKKGNLYEPNRKIEEGFVSGSPTHYKPDLKKDVQIGATGAYEYLKPSTEECPSPQAFAGPNDHEMIAFSCTRAAFVYNVKDHTSSKIPSPSHNALLSVHGIASDGTVAGCAEPGDQNSHPFFYKDGKLTLFKMNGCANGVNAGRSVVGYRDSQAFYYSPGTSSDQMAVARETEFSPPGHMRFCASNCFNLEWNAGEYQGISVANPNGPMGRWVLESFTLTSVRLHRTESSNGAQAIITGKIGSDGKHLDDCSQEWLGKGTSHCELTWDDSVLAGR